MSCNEVIDAELMADGIETILDVWRVRTNGPRRELAVQLAAHFVATHDSAIHAELEQAWRNGWGSALNFLRAADDMAGRKMVMAKDKATHDIIRDLVGKWVEIIDGLTDEATALAGEIGFATPPADPSPKETR